MSGFGEPGADVAPLLGGAMLLLSLAMLGQRRLPALVGALAAQGALLAAAAAWQGHVQGAPQLFLVALIAFAAKAVAIPLLLRRMLARRPPARRAEALARPGALMAAGAAMVALAILVAPAATAVGARARMDLAVALAVLLLGALMLAARRSALAQVAGLMTLENGLILAALGAAGMPLVPGISAAGLVLVVAALLALRLREGLGGGEADALQRSEGR